MYVCIGFIDCKLCVRFSFMLYFVVNKKKYEL